MCEENKNPVEKLPEEEFTCLKHGKYWGRKISFSLFQREPVLMSPSCPKCDAEQEAEREKQAEKAKKQGEIQRLVNMNIDKKYWNEDFETFNAYTAELLRHFETCRKFAENQTGKLVMLGENGTGKTHLAVSILKKVGGKIYTAYEIGLMLRQSYGGATNEWEIFNELCTVPLLIIDEVEKIKDSESKQNWVSHVIGKRYNRLLPIIFIANCHTQADCKEAVAPCPKCLEYHLENDVLSRIFEDGTLMEFTGEDYRYKIRATGRRKC